MAELVQRYAHAAISTNLKCDQYHMDADILMAIAMAGGLSALLTRVKYLHDATAYKALLQAWTVRVEFAASVRKWKPHWHPKRIAKISLDYWIADQCSGCQGTGFPVMRGIPTRSPKACAICAGTGRQPINCSRQYREPALDMYQELYGTFYRARERAHRKLHGRKNT